MRIALSLVTLIGLTASAFGADLGDSLLRGSQAWTPNFVPGSPIFYRWEGFYVGGQLGYAGGKADFRQGNSDRAHNVLGFDRLEVEDQASLLAIIREVGAHGSGWGGFAGYNFQFADAIVGLDVNYNSSDMTLSGSNSVSGSFTSSEDFLHRFTISSKSTVQMTDYGSIRFRGGWSANWFMPYITGGLAVARADVTRSATVTDLISNPTNRPAPPFLPASINAVTQSDIKNADLNFGYALGVGVDVALLPNVFMRGEYEYLRFGDVRGIAVDLSVVRAGAGVKF
jgi:outer membrane immunogenic protein